MKYGIVFDKFYSSHRMSSHAITCHVMTHHYISGVLESHDSLQKHPWIVKHRHNSRKYRRRWQYRFDRRRTKVRISKVCHDIDVMCHQVIPWQTWQLATCRWFGIRRSTVLLCFYILGYLAYLVLGGYIMSLLEIPFEEQLKTKTQLIKEQFLFNHPNVNSEWQVTCFPRMSCRNVSCFQKVNLSTLLRQS